MKHHMVHQEWHQYKENHIRGVIVSVLASSAVDRGFEPRAGQTKDYKIGFCCFTAKHVSLVQSRHHHHFIEN